MSLQLISHFVAFIDILGFSAMVKADCESADDPKYLPLLYDAHIQAVTLLGNDVEAGLMQFSDSIILSKPFDLQQLGSFLNIISRWQRELLLRGLLCRGGIAFGKHFVKDRFLFSKAMIDAYRLESLHAKFPRVLVSNDLIELARGQIDIDKLSILKEDDDAIFVNYLKVSDIEIQKSLRNSITKIIEKTKNSGPDIKEKIRWLSRYSDYIINTNVSIPQFNYII